MLMAARSVLAGVADATPKSGEGGLLKKPELKWDMSAA